VRHARADALVDLEPMLAMLRGLPGLTERSRGVFYRGSKAFLHFHEDPSGHHADVRLTGEFERFRVQTKAEQRAVVAKVRRALGRALAG
jgi:hypothetical protein